MMTSIAEISFERRSTRSNHENDAKCEHMQTLYSTFLYRLDSVISDISYIVAQ